MYAGTDAGGAGWSVLSDHVSPTFGGKGTLVAKPLSARDGLAVLLSRLSAVQRSPKKVIVCPTAEVPSPMRNALPPR